MKDLFNQIGNSLGGLGDKLNGALGGQQQPASGQGGGLGNALGDVVKSAGGFGGLLGSAALGGLLGTLLSGKTARKVAQGALMEMGGQQRGGSARVSRCAARTRAVRLARRAGFAAAPRGAAGSDGVAAS